MLQIKTNLSLCHRSRVPQLILLQWTVDSGQLKIEQLSIVHCPLSTGEYYRVSN